MEAILAMVAIWIGWTLFQMALSAGARTVGAAAKAVIGKGTFSENMDLAFRGMGPLECRLTDQSDEGAPYKAIEVKGLFPVSKKLRAAFITSIFDKTDGEWQPVKGALEVFQEPQTSAYRHTTEIGSVASDQGFVRWVRVSAIIPPLLEPPIGGRRNFVAVLRMVNLDQMPDISLGKHTQDDPGILWMRSLEFTCETEGKGYLEAAKHRDRARALSIKIAMAVAMGDGSLHDSEGHAMRDWVLRVISPYSDDRREELRTLYNEAMKDAYRSAVQGELSLSALTDELNSIAERAQRYETIELCFDVMTADGVASPDEMKLIRRIASSLELDLDEIEKMRDTKIVDIGANIVDHASIEQMLGIESDWDVERIKIHLRNEFQKWNNRLNALSEGAERESAQNMLNLIAQARKKYG